jgi:hypothetical protein
MKMVLKIRWSGGDGGGCESTVIETTDVARLRARVDALIAAIDEYDATNPTGNVDEVTLEAYDPPVPVSEDEGLRITALWGGVGDGNTLPPGV